MAQRIITGLVLAPIVIWLVLWAPKSVFGPALLSAAAQGVDELMRMYPDVRKRDRTVLAVLAIATAAGISGAVAPMFLFAIPLTWLTYCLIAPGTVEAAGQRAMAGMLGLGYVATLFGVIARLFANTTPVPGGAFDLGRAGVLTLMMVVFAGDTGAYFAGRSFGKHKLYELISPKKTIEGAIGGLTASILAGWLAQRLLLPQLTVVQALLLGATAGIAGQIGDLAESLFKRATGTKDSGTLLPGHGGILDRLDGVLFAAPVVLAWLQFS